MENVKIVELYLPQWIGGDGKTESCDVYFLNATEAYSHTKKSVGKYAVYPLCKKAACIDGEYYMLSEKCVIVNPVSKIKSSIIPQLEASGAFSTGNEFASNR